MAGLKRTALNQEHATAAGKIALLTTAPVLVLALVVVLLTALAAPHGHRGSALDLLRASLWLAGLAWHGTLAATVRGTVAGEEDFSGGSFEAVASASAAPLLLTGVSIGLLFWLSRRDEHRRPSRDSSQLAGRGVLTAGILAAGWVLLALVSRASKGFGLDLAHELGNDISSTVRFSLGLDPVRTAISVLAISLVVSLAGRFSAAALETAQPSWVVSCMAAFRAAVRLVTAVVASTAVVFLVYAIVETSKAVSDSENTFTTAVTDPNNMGPYAGVAIWAALLPNVLITAAGFALGSDVSATSDGALSGYLPSLLNMNDLPTDALAYGLFSDSSRPAWFYILLVTSLVGALAGAVRSILRSTRKPLSLGTAAQWVVATATLWAALSWLAGASVHVSAQATGQIATNASSLGGLDWHGRAGLTYTGIIGLAVVWTAAAYLAATAIAPSLGGIAPRTLAIVGASRSHRLAPSWSLSLADAAVRMGKTIPAWLRVDADNAARAGVAVEQVRIRPKVARRIVVTGSAVAIVAAALVGGYAYASTRLYGPVPAAQQYLDAVSSGNATAALALARVEGGNTTLLVDQVLKAQLKAAPMTAVHVGKADITADSATVEVSYAIKGDLRTTALHMVKDDNRPKWGGLFKEWAVVDPFAEVTIDGDGEKVRVANKTVTGGTYKMFPGQVAATRPNTKMYLGGSTSSWLPLPGDKGTLSLGGTLRPAIAEKVKDEVVQAVNACMNKGELKPFGCPFGVDAYLSGRAVGVRWRMDGPLRQTLSVTGVGSSVRVSGQVPMTVAYTDVSEYSSDPASEDVTADVSATVTYTDAEPMVVTFDNANVS
ncbi:hypothetical protein ABEG17_06580 [Pedococcus sp. KACC 23699]|uniref:Uncharacterized protein n=1 Tax=Pedococcus sp. KACC 23699 TaxID=3149228 RepID=A0AAU7JXF3_9MICO